jgi:hypothetical protein
MRVRAEFPILEKSYDLVIWLHGRTRKFPRNLRGGIGLRLETAVLDLHELLGQATTTRNRVALLDEASERLDGLRRMLRICLGLKLLSVKQFGFASQQLDETGRMLGGWLRKEKGGKAANLSGASTPPRGPGEAATGTK